MKKQTKSDLIKMIEKQEETVENLRRLLTIKLKVVSDDSRLTLTEEIRLNASRYVWLRQQTADLFMVTPQQMDEQIDQAMEK